MGDREEHGMTIACGPMGPDLGENARLREENVRLLAVADNLADRLRSANAVIERMVAAQFNPAILDRIREALIEHRDVCGIKGLRDGD